MTFNSIGVENADDCLSFCLSLGECLNVTITQEETSVEPNKAVSMEGEMMFRWQDSTMMMKVLGRDTRCTGRLMVGIAICRFRMPKLDHLMNAHKNGSMFTMQVCNYELFQSGFQTPLVNPLFLVWKWQWLFACLSRYPDKTLYCPLCSLISGSAGSSPVSSSRASF